MEATPPPTRQRPPRPPIRGVGVLALAAAATLLGAPGARGQEAGSRAPDGALAKGRMAVAVRGGLVVTTPYLEGEVPSFRPGESVISDVTLAPDPAPWLGAALVWAVEPPVELQLSVTASRTTLGITGAVDEWDAGDVTVLTGIAGFRYHFLDRLVLGAGLGLATRSGSELPWLRDAGPGFVFEGMVGIRPLDDVPLAVEVTAQGHSLGGAALRTAGGRDGDVARILAGLAWIPGGER